MPAGAQVLGQLPNARAVACGRRMGRQATWRADPPGMRGVLSCWVGVLLSSMGSPAWGRAAQQNMCRSSFAKQILAGAATHAGCMQRCRVQTDQALPHAPSALAGLPAMSTSPARGVSVCCSAVLPLHAASAAGVAAGWGAAVVWMGRSGTSDTSSGHQRPQWLRGKRLHTYTFLQGGRKGGAGV